MFKRYTDVSRFTKVLFIKVVWLLLSVSIVSNTRYITDMSYKDMKTSSTPLHTRNAVSWIQCALYCELMETCSRFSYNPHRGSATCTLFSEKCLHFNVPEQGIRHYRQRPDRSPDRCSSCPATYTCDDSTPVTLCARYYYLSGVVGQGDYRHLCCQDGGELIRIDSAYKQQAVENVLSQDREIWIQGLREKGDNQWVYLDGTPMPYTNWASQFQSFPQFRLIVIRETENGYKWFEKIATRYTGLGALCEYSVE